MERGREARGKKERKGGVMEKGDEGEREEGIGGGGNGGAR